MRYLTPKLTCIFFVIFYCVGILGFSFQLTRNLFQHLVSFNLIVSVFFLFWFHSPRNLKSLLIFGSIFLAGFLSELTGVNTHLIFGSYSYGNTLGFKIFQTPLLIGLNWLILIYCIFLITDNLNKKWYFPFMGSAVMVIYDIIMEPVAIRIGMWDWDGGQIPVKNYISWYLISLGLFFFLYFTKPAFKNPVARCLFFVQFGFFLFLNFLFRIV
jgi:uncharacterized membrane protein